jgi:hypothetical protein
MPRPTLSDRYAVAPGPAGQPAQLAFRSRDSEWPGYYPICGVSSTHQPDLRPKLSLALTSPLQRLSDATKL